MTANPAKDGIFGSLLGGAVGGAAGLLVGNPVAGAVAGAGIGNKLDPAGEDSAAKIAKVATPDCTEAMSHADIKGYREAMA